MIALVTGGAGYIGSTVSNYLIDKGHKVIIVDNLSTGNFKNVPKRAEFFKANIQDTKKISQIFLKRKINVVFHFAAYIDNEESIQNPKKYYQGSRSMDLYQSMDHSPFSYQAFTFYFYT